MEQWASVPSKRQGPGFRVKLSEAGAFLSLSLPICRFIILCPFHSVGSELAHSINLFSSLLCAWLWAGGWTPWDAAFLALMCIVPASLWVTSPLGTHIQEGLTLGLNPCVLLSPSEILNFWTGGTTFSFCTGPCQLCSWSWVWSKNQRCFLIAHWVWLLWVPLRVGTKKCW